MSGVFITFEGTDGSGKSTQAKILAEFLRTRGKTVRETREPGGVGISEDIRKLILNPDYKTDMCRETEFFLFCAARAQHYREFIAPAVEQGDWVICDRFFDSTFAYQGYGRKMIADGHNLVMRDCTALACNGKSPDLTIMIQIPIQESIRRLKDRGQTDRIESVGEEFMERVAVGFQVLADRNPSRITVFDGMAPIHPLAATIASHVLKLFPN